LQGVKHFFDGVGAHGLIACLLQAQCYLNWEKVPRKRAKKMPDMVNRANLRSKRGGM